MLPFLLVLAFTLLWVAYGLLVCVPVLTFFHELGHAIACKCLGVPVKGFTVGGRFCRVSFTCLGVPCHISPFAFTGVVHHGHLAPQKWRQCIVISFAGPLAELLIALGALCAFWFLWFTLAGAVVLLPLAICAVCGAMGNLWPATFANGDLSDGKYILHAWRTRHQR